MEITQFAVKIILLFLPGIIITFAEDRNTYTSENSSTIIILKTIIYGALSYTVLALLYRLLNLFGGSFEVHFFIFLNSKDEPINFFETFIVSLIAIGISIIKAIWTNIVYENNHLININNTVKTSKYVLVNKKKKFINYIVKIVLCINGMLEKCKILKSGIGDNDVWNYVFTNINTEVIVTDRKNKIAYHGTLTLNSYNHQKGELFLENVLIVDLSTSNFRYAEAIYLAKDTLSSLEIEIRPTDNIDETNTIVNEISNNSSKRYYTKDKSIKELIEKRRKI